MSNEDRKYLIIISGKLDEDYPVHDRFKDILLDNQSSLNFKKVEEFYSDLTELSINYLFTNLGLREFLGNRFKYAVLLLSDVDNPFSIDEEMDTLFRESVFSFEGMIMATMFYLIEEDGEYRFHKVTNGRVNEEEIEDHLNTNDTFNDANLFYQHFYNNSEYKDDKQIAMISKMMLVAK